MQTHVLVRCTRLKSVEHPTVPPDRHWLINGNCPTPLWPLAVRNVLATSARTQLNCTWTPSHRCGGCCTLEATEVRAASRQTRYPVLCYPRIRFGGKPSGCCCTNDEANSSVCRTLSPSSLLQAVHVGTSRTPALEHIRKVNLSSLTEPTFPHCIVFHV